MAGLENHRRRSGLTGQMALSPCSGSRMMLLTKEEAARFSTRPYADGGQAQYQTVDEALAAVVVDQQFPMAFWAP